MALGPARAEHARLDPSNLCSRAMPPKTKVRHSKSLSKSLAKSHASK